MCILGAMGDSTLSYPPGAPGVRDGGTRPGNPDPAGQLPDAGAGPLIADDPGRPSGGPGGPEPGPAMVPAAPAIIYWRRRFVVLAVVLATLAVAAWSLSEAFRVQPDHGRPATTGGGMGGRNPSAPGASPGGATGTGKGNHGSGGSAGRIRTRTRHRPAGARKPEVSPSPGAFGGFKPAFCSWHSIVISASANQVEFAPDQRPAFSLSVVSTQPTDCSFNVGPGHLALLIKEDTVRIWSSADCVKGTASLITALRRGVPTVVAIGWNKKTSAPGCPGPARPVPAGSYTAYAVDGSLSSAPVTFRLR